MDNRPIIGITMGDPAGIGPEIIVKALTDGTQKAYRALVIGSGTAIKKATTILGSAVEIISIDSVDKALFSPNTIEVLDISCADLAQLEYGKLSAQAGEAAFLSVKRAIELAMDGSIAATVNAPLNKEALQLAGHHFAGQTEIYAQLTDTPQVAMMLAEGSFRVIHVSTHVSLRQACDLVKQERVLQTIMLAHDGCQCLGIASPRIGVAGLNPHSSENSMFGHEEQLEIIPAIVQAQAMGINAQGPIPPDTLFCKARGGMYDIAVAMYHDQGHIPLKMAGFTWRQDLMKWDTVSGVNITLGLPIIRCSVDHGTAFDVAGKGIATAQSLHNALDYALMLCAAKVAK